MRRLFEAAGLAILSVTLMSCATMNVSSHVRHGIDFSQYRTFALEPGDAMPTGDPRLDRDPFFQDHMQGAVIREMSLKGLEHATSGTPDLRLHYHASITARIDVNRTDAGYCYDETCGLAAVEFEAGTLVLDAIDTRTNRLVWRGWAQEALDDMLTNRRKMARRIDTAVSRMLARLPVTRVDAPRRHVGTGGK